MTFGRPAQSKPISLTEKAVIELREAILRLEHPPGAPLRLDALQQRYGLSSSPLREALNRLMADGLVLQDSNRGFRVAGVNAAEFRELTEMRLLLETEALRQSLRLGDDAWEGRVVAARHQLRKAEEELPQVTAALDERWSAAHRAFHLELFSGCPSQRLRRECAQLFGEADRYRRLTAEVRRSPRNKDAEHAAIMTAALARDEARAVELLRAHIQFTFDAMIQSLLGDDVRPSQRRSLRSAA